MSKVWFITGAGSGIGAGAAKAALKAGDRVVATGRNVQKVRNALRDVASENLEILQLDVSDEAQATRAFDQAVKRFGRVDVVLNNAGYSLLGNFEELGTQDIERQFATNFWGVMYVMRAALPVMRKQRSGHIINMSSVAGVVGLKHCSAYGAAKFAVEGLSLPWPRKSKSSGSRSRLWSRDSSARTCWPTQRQVAEQPHRRLRFGRGKRSGDVVSLRWQAARRSREARRSPGEARRHGDSTAGIRGRE